MLTQQQKEARYGRITASRVGALMSGRPEQVNQLWLEMTGQQQEENLDHVWAVQLGVRTEHLNLNWYEIKNGRLLTKRGEFVVHPELPWAGCTLDGFDDEIPCPVECKHVGGNEPVEVIIDRYQPQMHWQMACTQTTQCALSQIRGAREPLVEFIDFDAAYYAEILKRAEYFRMCLDMGRTPAALCEPPPPVDKKLVIDMTGNNRWADCATEWVQMKPFHDKCEDLGKILKMMVPPEAKRAFGHGVRVSRDRAGRLSLRGHA